MILLFTSPFLISVYSNLKSCPSVLDISDIAVVLLALRNSSLCYC